MPFQILLNIFIAFLWMFFQDEWKFLSFLSGYIVGLIILFFMRRFFNKPFYILFVWAALKLIYVFARELLGSAILVIKQVLRPKINITPGIFRIDTDLEGDIEITLISLLICLTPGSVVMEVTPDGKSLYVHAMDVPESKDSVLKSQIIFERAIKDVTRKYV
ncbi:Na+/H+ antiporter subunit E [Ornithinibacillus halotolerans]|uniref:Na+/H+ antiporter subunit E n=1 Tax=Ornithinibacillus halotolerans TaxID=1274357 RepID=A0A916RVX1_9BACI|nr:Na+/H+ antiporter subunit E [Ornithinibacillus halotolerans]GGA72734.1 Na+/H+ antiporter subunit E [Ornithinibacillus halotolerans]